MKSRVTTYMLIAAVLAVWGVVAWRLFFLRSDTSAASPVVSARRETVEPERDFLLLDYKDPFLKNNRTTPVQTPVATAPRPVTVPPQRTARPAPSPPLRYAGTIKKNGSHSYLFEYSGLLHTLSPGDEFEGYTLTEIYADSAKLTKGGEHFTLFIQR